MSIKFKSFSLYRVVFVAILTAPSLITQTVVPVISYDWWEELSETMFPYFMTFKSQLDTEDSKVVIIKTGRETRDQLGWPIDRSNFIALLDQLKESGHPHLVSFLQFQSLARPQADGTPGDSELAQKDQAWIDSVKDYGKFIGSPISIDNDEEPTDEQEKVHLPRVALSKPGSQATGLGSLPFVFEESSELVSAQKAFGFGPRLGTETTIYCTQPYLGDDFGNVAIPTSLLWAAAFTSESSMELSNGAVWPRQGEKIDYTFRGKLDVGYKQCIANPSISTSEFLESRKIQTYELSEVLNSELPDLTNKIVVLATTDTRKYRGPGNSFPAQSNIAYEYELAARFLDGLITGDTIKRNQLRLHQTFDWLPIVVASLLATMSFFFGTGAILSAAMVTLFALIAYSAIRLTNGLEFIIPIQTLASTTLGTIGVIGMQLFLKYHGVRRTFHFSKNLRNSLGKCNTLEEITKAAVLTARKEFQVFELGLSGYNQDLYYAASSPENAIEYLEEYGLKNLEAPQSKFKTRPGKLSTVITMVKRPPDAGRLALGSRGITAKIAVTNKDHRVGTAEVLLSYKPHEELFVADMINTFQEELSIHWGRIELLVKQMLKDYQSLMLESRANIVSKFLSQSLLKKFSNAKTMDQNLHDVLTPRPVKVALLQADIRGFASMSKESTPIEIAERLQLYYREVVDAAQQFAQVKLIGDCVFLFIEEQGTSAEKTATDLALEIASLLVRETRLQNSKTKDKSPINFGIAIHYGEVVVGNLSSENCIDYTVIGNNVNQVARIEEATKMESIRDTIGANGILLTSEAIASLNKFKEFKFEKIDLQTAKVSIRSFSEIETLSYIKAEDCESIIPNG